jgi:hypothetical protein
VTFLPTVIVNLFRTRSYDTSYPASTPSSSATTAAIAADVRSSRSLLILASISLTLNRAGAACLVALTILDDLHHKAVHYMLLSAALPAYFFSAVLCCGHDCLALRRAQRVQLELSSSPSDYYNTYFVDDDERSVGDEKTAHANQSAARRRRRCCFRQAASWREGTLWFRIALLTLEFVLLTLFSAFCWANVLYDEAGVIEWCVAGIFGMYIGSFVPDFWAWTGGG